jgi:hypothetical protein
MVGLGGLEPPTSSLSGMRSSHLSYRPKGKNWWSWSGSNRRPPECKSGALPAELQPQTSTACGTRGGPAAAEKLNRGQLDAGTKRDQLAATSKRTGRSKWRCQDGLTILAEARIVVWSGTAVSYRASAYTPRKDFRKLHPRSLLERR